MLVTADHGNAERMIDEEGNPVTKHTTFRGSCSTVVVGLCILQELTKHTMTGVGGVTSSLYGDGGWIASSTRVLLFPPPSFRVQGSNLSRVCMCYDLVVGVWVLLNGYIYCYCTLCRT